MKVHLLMTGLVTDKRISGKKVYKFNEFLGNPLESFLSMLCSIQNFEFYSADVYVKLDAEYEHFADLVSRQISSKLKANSVYEYSHRLDSFSSWRTAARKISDQVDLVLLMSNLDHVYVASDKSLFYDFAESLKHRPVNSFGWISHWQEAVAMSKSKMTGKSEKSNLLLSFPITRPHGTALLPKTFFQSWWQEDFTQNHKIIRPDNPFGPSVEFKNSVPAFSPLIELFRHIDGYSHADIKSRYASRLRPCCSVSNGQVIHREWVRGFSKSVLADIPFGPSEDLFEYLLNLNSCYLRPILSLKILSRHRSLVDSVKLLTTLVLTPTALVSFINRVKNGFFHYYFFKRVMRILLHRFIHQSGKIKHKFRINLI